MVAVALGFGTALCWGLADFLGGIRTRRLSLPLVLLASQLTALAAITAVVLAGRIEAPSFGDLAPALGAGVCQLVGIAALYRALAIGTMSVISPISASGAALLPVVVGVAGGERPSALQLAGMTAALIGVILATRSPQGSGAVSSGQSLGLAAIAALGFGGFYVGMDASVEQAEPFSALLAARSSAAAALLLAVALARPRIGGNLVQMPSLMLIGLLDVSANACFTLGTDTGLLSVVSVLASLYPVATVVLARALLGERLASVQAAGVAVALMGVVLIATG